MELCGVGNKNFVSHVRTILNHHHPEILALLETRIKSAWAKPIFKALGFTKWFLINEDGYSRGIWLAWKDFKIKVEILINNFQFVYTCIKPNYREDWYFTFVYANPDVGMKANL